jgi:hypothetical protein
MHFSSLPCVLHNLLIPHNLVTKNIRTWWRV